MSDPEPIDLSQLKNLNLAPDWVGDLQKREAAAGEVIWGRAPDHERESRGGGQGQGFGGGGGGGGRGPRRDGGGFGARGDFNRPGGPPRGPRPDGPRGPRPDDRGPRPGGPGGFGGPRPEGPRGPRPEGPPRSDGPRGPRPGGPPAGDRGPRPGGPPRDDRRGGPDRREGGRPDFRNDRGRGPGRFDDRPHIEPLPGWRVRLFAEPRSLEAITRQVKASGRAYPVFELGRLFLAGRDRYVAEFSRQPHPQVPRNAPKGTPAPAPEPIPGPEQIYHIPADGSLWLNRDDAIRHLINGPALKKLYRKETVSIDPPKGIFTAVAVCGFSGEILGPPNHHSFQTTVARLHREQFYNLPIDRYKARIRTEKDETLVAKWLEEQSSTTVYYPLTAGEMAALEAAEAAAKAAPAPENLPKAVEQSDTSDQSDQSDQSDSPVEAEAPPEPAAETTPPEAVSESPDPGESPPDATDAVETPAAAEEAQAPAAAEVPKAEPLKNWAAVEAHFLAHHADQAVKAVSRIKVPGNIPGRLLAPSLLALLRMEVEQQQRFPMQLVQDLCRDLEKENLKFFKRDKKATFVCRTRPHFIDDESHLSPRLRSIVGVVRANPNITVGKLVSVLAPHVEKPLSKTSPAAAKPTSEEAVNAEPAPAAPATLPSDAATPELAPPADAPPEEPTAEAVPAGETPGPGGIPDAPPPTEAPIVETPAAPAAAEAPRPEPNQPANAPQGREPRERGPKNQRGKKPAPAAETPPAPLTPEEIGVLQDLRWLVQEGFVTEFANSELQLLGRPPQPPAEKKPKGEPKAAATEGPASPAGPAASSIPAESEIPASSPTEDTAPVPSPEKESASAATTTADAPETAGEATPAPAPAPADAAGNNNDTNTPSASGDQPLL